LVGLAYDRQGEGPELLLLHGLGHRRQAWNAVLDLLTPHRHVITVDLPGHGDSPPLKTNGADPVEAIGAELIDTMDQLGIHRPHVAGNSLGGALALGAAARGRARSVTALSPAGFWVADWQYHYTKAMFGALKLAGPIKPLMPRLAQSAAGRAVMHGTVVARPSRLTPEQALGDAEAFFRATDAVDEVLAKKLTFTESANIPADVPVTIAWAEKDRILLPSQARVAKRELPQARLILLRGCGHVPMTDDPRTIARILLQGSSSGS
jgi:pimeloyl-ACP methyl ester carboxylesterase